MKGNREEIFYHFGDFPAYAARERLSEYPNMAGIGHWHEDVEFIAVLEGEMTYWINGTSCRMEKGEGVFVNARQIHYGYSADGKDGEFICVRFHPSLIGVTEEIRRRYVMPVVGRQEVAFLKLSSKNEEQKRILELVCRVRKACERQGEELELEMEGLFFGIWRLVCRQMRISGEQGKERDPRLPGLYQMMEFIQKNYAEKLRLEDIAREGKMCRSSCCKLFREYLHKSPVTYLTEYRIRRSMELLDSSAPITEIAMNCGFSGASYFAEIFRRVAGCTPGEYRKRCREQAEGREFAGGGRRGSGPAATDGEPEEDGSFR